MIVKVNFSSSTEKTRNYLASTVAIFLFSLSNRLKERLYNEHANKKPSPRNNSQLGPGESIREKTILAFVSLVEFSKTNFSGNSRG